MDQIMHPNKVYILNHFNVSELTKRGKGLRGGGMSF